MERSEYLRDENWEGSYYELSLELGPCGGDALATRALHELWRRPELRGPWRERSLYGSDPDSDALSLTQVRFYGCLTLDDGTELGCMSHLIRVDGESDWLDLSIPTGMLNLRFPVSYPLGVSTNRWLAGLDDRMARIGAALHREVPFRLGLLGEERGGASTAAELTAADCELGGFLVPAPLWRKLAPNREPILLTDGLAYFPYLDFHITFGP